MRKVLILICVVISTLSVDAQTYIYDGDATFRGVPVLNVTNGSVLPELSFMRNEAYLTATDEQIFTGFSTSVFDELYWIDEGRLFPDRTLYSGDCMYTFDNGKIYQGDSTMMIDQLYTYKNGYIYEGNQTTRLDILYTVQGDLSVSELFAVMLVLELL